MTTTKVQVAHGDIIFGSTNPSPCAVAFGSNVTSGNYLVVGVVFRDTSNTAPSGYTLTVTDTIGLTFTQAGSFNFWNSNISRNSVMYFYIAKTNSSAADTITVDITAGLGTCKGGLVVIWEISGLIHTAPENTANGGQNHAAAGVPTLGNLTWSSTDPFCAAMVDDVQSGATPAIAFINASITTISVTSQNDTFGAGYFTDVSSSFGAPPCNFSWNSDNFTESGWSGLSIAFPGGTLPVTTEQTLVSVIACCS